jgi:hypothetical protein
MSAPWTELLELLVPSTAAGYIDLRAFNDRRADLFPREVFVKADAPNREDQIAQFAIDSMIAGYDCYMGVAERGIASGKKTACSILRALFIDIDVVKEGLDFDATLARLKSFVQAPTLIVNSGGGLHAYFTLPTPINLWESGEVAKTESVLRRLAVALGGDLKATDVSRVLRLPGTINQKTCYNAPLVEVLV